jgi:cell division protein FtsN
MHEEALVDDQSHYEVSLTAGQAFLAFVLLLLSLAASFAFGLLIGRGQADDKLTARREQPAVVNEATSVPAKQNAIAVRDDDFKQAPAAKITEEPAVTAAVTPEPRAEKAAEPVKKASPPRAAAVHAAPPVPHFAQVLSTSDQKTAETLAAKLIDNGFTSGYVERTTTEKGTVYRVRVKFRSEEEARAAEAKLRTFSKDVWITK